MVRFEIPACDAEALARLRQSLGVSDAVGQTLVRRGYADPVQAKAFLAAGEEHALERFDGLLPAAELILARARAGAKITVHGDYDVDGVCSTAVLVRALRRVGASVDWHLPDRAGGYGLRAATVRRLAERGTQLLVTADCGITAVEEVELARGLGIETVVTDHHQPRADGALPDCQIVHPGVGGYPCEELCATAVAHKLARAVAQLAGGSAAGMEAELDADLDLVALATIADVVELRGENRTLTRRGLRALRATAKPGLRALMAVARVDPGRVNERAVGFGLAPRINAAGRMYRADAALELLLTQDRERAARIAQELDRANGERRHAEQRIRYEAEAQIARLEDRGERGSYVLGGEGWHPGVIGIVASRLSESLRRPVVLVALPAPGAPEGQSARGSGRGIEGYDLLAGLTACAGHLTRYGGHAAAAGVELQSADLDAFAAALERHAAAALASVDTAPRERVDAVVECGQVTMDLAEELQALAPFGRGNPNVSLMLDGASVRDVKAMGEGKHARFTVAGEDGAHVRAVAFGCDGGLGVREGEPVRATFTLEVNEWRGASEPRLVLRHVGAAGHSELDPAPEVLRAGEASPGHDAVHAAEAVDAGLAKTAREGATLKACQTRGQAQPTLFELPTPAAASAAAT